MNNEKIIQLLEEILKWTRFQGMSRVREVLNNALREDEEKIVYYYSDGRSSREIAKIAGLSHTKIVDYWKRWWTLGIVEPIRVQRGIRYKKSFSLLDFGIEVPKVKVEELPEIQEGSGEKNDYSG